MAGAWISAASAARPLIPSRTRSITPKLRQSGSGCVAGKCRILVIPDVFSLRLPHFMTTNAAQYTWAGRFSEPVSDLVKRYTASVDFEQRMWRQDIRGSLAHARMLAKQGIIAAAVLADIERGMAIVSEEIESGKFEWSLDLEDVHLNIEKRLTALVGDAGKRLHTGRSRNDQVATDIRLYLCDAIDDIQALL